MGVLLELMLASRHSHFLRGKRSVETVFSLQPVCGHYAFALRRMHIAVVRNFQDFLLLGCVIEYLDFPLSSALQLVASKLGQDLSCVFTHVDSQSCSRYSNTVSGIIIRQTGRGIPNPPDSMRLEVLTVSPNRQ